MVKNTYGRFRRLCRFTQLCRLINESIVRLHNTPSENEMDDLQRYLIVGLRLELAPNARIDRASRHLGQRLDAIRPILAGLSFSVIQAGNENGSVFINGHRLRSSRYILAQVASTCYKNDQKAIDKAMSKIDLKKIGNNLATEWLRYSYSCDPSDLQSALSVIIKLFDNYWRQALIALTNPKDLNGQKIAGLLGFIFSDPLYLRYQVPPEWQPLSAQVCDKKFSSSVNLKESTAYHFTHGSRFIVTSPRKIVAETIIFKGLLPSATTVTPWQQLLQSCFSNQLALTLANYESPGKVESIKIEQIRIKNALLHQIFLESVFTALSQCLLIAPDVKKAHQNLGIAYREYIMSVHPDKESGLPSPEVSLSSTKALYKFAKEVNFRYFSPLWIRSLAYIEWPHNLIESLRIGKRMTEEQRSRIAEFVAAIPESALDEDVLVDTLIDAYHLFSVPAITASTLGHNTRHDASGDLMLTELQVGECSNFSYFSSHLQKQKPLPPGIKNADWASVVGFEEKAANDFAQRWLCAYRKTLKTATSSNTNMRGTFFSPHLLLETEGSKRDEIAASSEKNQTYLLIKSP